MIKYNFNNYNFIKKESIKILIKNLIFYKKNININFVSLLEVFILNKLYKKIYTSTNILIFKNYFYKKKIFEIFICNIIIESESNLVFKKLNFNYLYLIIHGFLHSQKFNHNYYFSKKNIFNFFELKFFYKLGFKNFYKYDLNFYKYIN